MNIRVTCATMQLLQRHKFQDDENSDEFLND